MSKKSIFKTKLRWLWQKSRMQRYRLVSNLKSIWLRYEPVWIAVIISISLLIALAKLAHDYESMSAIVQGIYIESWGTVFDIIIVGILLTIFTTIRNRKDLVERYLEEIEDFKRWDNIEAQLRIAGNIRRLARLGKTDIDFCGIELHDFSFQGHDIESLKGSIFSMGLRIDKLSKNSTKLTDVCFNFVDCTNVVFSKPFGKSAALGLIGKNLSFVNTKLINACFDGSELTWTDFKENTDDWYEDEGFDRDYGQIINQIHYPAFSGADLNGSTFCYTKLEHADFREATNILNADFTGATGLNTCFFDDCVREQIMANAKLKSSSE